MMNFFKLQDIQIILSLAGTALTLLITTLMFFKKFIKNKKAKKVIEQVEKIGNMLIPFIVQAEGFINFNGQEKKEYVMTKANQYAIENNINFDSELVSEKIEDLVTLSKLVNKKNKTLNETMVTEVNEEDNISAIQKAIARLSKN